MTRIFDDLVDCKRLLREICILKCLDHPNVVRIKTILRPPDLENFNELFVVMEHAQSDLKKLVKSAIHLEEDHIQLISYNILAGIKYIHSANILHRDLKPANILLNEDCEVKICDFGLARSVAEEQKANEGQEEEKKSTSNTLELPRSGNAPPGKPKLTKSKGGGL